MLRALCGKNWEMKYTLLHNHDGQRTFLLVFSTGDNLTEGILSFAAEHQIRAAQLTAIGGLSEIKLAFFDWDTKEYNPIPVQEQVELVSLIGNISLHEGQPKLHAHVVIGKSDGSAWAGHLLEATVRPTVELFLAQWPVELHRVKDEDSGLPLLDI